MRLYRGWWEIGHVGQQERSTKTRDGEEDMGLQAASRTEVHFTKTGLKAVDEKNEEVLKRTRINWDLCSISVARQPASCVSNYHSFFHPSIHSFCSAFYVRPMASSEASSPQIAIQCFLFQFPVSSLFFMAQGRNSYKTELIDQHKNPFLLDYSFM